MILNFFRTIIWFAYFFGYLIIIYPKQQKGLKALEQGDLKTSDTLAAHHVDRWINTLLKIAGAKVIVEGKENIPKDVACVFVANHRSQYDIPIILTQIQDKPIALLSKIEVNKLPFVRKWMLMLHCVFVDRKDPRKSMQALNEAIDVVKSGYSMAIFPEGTRFKGKEGEIGEFKAGAFRIAAKTKAPIVPIAISNSRDIMENNYNLMTPGTIHVKILPAIETKNLTKDEIKELPEKIGIIIKTNLKANENK